MNVCKLNSSRNLKQIQVLSPDLSFDFQTFETEIIGLPKTILRKR
jgi:hypothetical protein